MFHPKILIMINIRIIYTSLVTIKIIYKYSIEKRHLLTDGRNIRCFQL
jgi:hypothetical protein